MTKGNGQGKRGKDKKPRKRRGPGSTKPTLHPQSTTSGPLDCIWKSNTTRIVGSTALE